MLNPGISFGQKSTDHNLWVENSACSWTTCPLPNILDAWSMIYGGMEKEYMQ